MDEPETGQMPVVTLDDVQALHAQLRPGSAYSSASLWTRYVRLMEEARRPLATRNALGRALTAAGWKRHRARRRVAGKVEETSSWIVPGAPPVDEEGERMKATLAALGGGIHPEELIQDTYFRLAREHGWRWTTDRAGIIRWLTKNGYHRMIEKGKRSRYVPGPVNS
jgi:hypothetical protein